MFDRVIPKIKRWTFLDTVLPKTERLKIIVHNSDHEFVVDRFFMRLLKTNDIDTVRECRQFFSFNLPSVTVKAVKYKSLFYVKCNNLSLNLRTFSVSYGRPA